MPWVIEARTRYAQTRDGIFIAYQVAGNGPPDLLVMFGFGVSVEDQLAGRWSARFIERLASFSRVIRFDRRGTGLSDRVASMSQDTYEQWALDALAVLDAVQSERAMVVTTDASLSVTAMMLAATQPERVAQLVLFNPAARVLTAPDYRCGFTVDEAEELLEYLQRGWLDGTPEVRGSPSVAQDPEFQHWWLTARRRGLSPSGVVTLFRNSFAADFRAALPTIRVPTLVLIRTPSDFPGVVFRDLAHCVAEHIPDAKLVTLPGADLLAYLGEIDTIAQEIEEFCTGTRSEPHHDRVLATVLFTDLVGSTEHAARIGDEAWHDRLDGHDAMVRAQLERHHGREVKTLGDGFLATFDGPARAINCGTAIVRGAEALGHRVRVGLHTGEIELRGDDIGGITVNIAARVVAAAHASEVLVSRTVVDLVAGSGITFTDRGEHTLKGIEGAWRLFAVAPA